MMKKFVCGICGFVYEGFVQVAQNHHPLCKPTKRTASTNILHKMRS